MTKILLYIIGFLLGIFVILNVISYRDLICKYIERFENKEQVESQAQSQAQTQSQTQEQQQSQPQAQPQAQSKTQEQAQDQSKGKKQKGICNKESLDSFTIYKFLQAPELSILTSCYDTKNIVDNTWKADNNNKTLTLSKPVSREPFELNPYIQGLNIQDVTIKGIQINDTKVLNELSLLYMLKIKDFNNNNNYLFELKCKSSTDFDEATKKKIYSENIIHIVIKDNSTVELSEITKKCEDDTDCKLLQNKLNKYINIYNNYYFYNKDRMKKDYKYIAKCRDEEKCKNMLTFQNELTFFDQLLETKLYSIEIRIGKEIFNIYNISNTMFHNDVIFMGLIIKNKQINFYINNSLFTFERQIDEDILTDDEPFSINENGGCNIVLYSFACYQTAICDTDISTFKLYNNYYLYGTNKYQDNIDMLQTANNELKKKLGM